jgi:hypothetical protein
MLLYNNTNATLNNLVAVFKDIADNHSQINDFFFGDVWDIQASTTTNYPLFAVTLLSNKLGNNTITHSFRFYFMDLINADSSNETEVKSNAITIQNGIWHLLRDYYDLEPLFTVNVVPFVEKFNDRVGGAYADVSIEVPSNFGWCNEPFKDCSSSSGDTFVFDSNNSSDCGGPSCLSLLNSPSVDFTGNGSTCYPLQANVNISQALGNNLLVMVDGLYASGGSSVVPGGANTQIQFNNNGVFGGDPNFTWDGSTFIIDYGANGSHQFDDNGYTFLFSNSGDNEFIINKGFFQYRVSNNLLISSDPTTAIFETSTGDGIYCTPGDATIGTASAWIEFTESNQLAEIVGTGGLLIDNLAGSGTRMVVVSSTGLLSTQAIPTSPVTSVFGRSGNVVLLSADVTGALGFTPTPNTRLITSTSPLSGGGALTSDLTLSIVNAKADGVTLGAASFTASDFNDNGSGLISIDYTNGQKATTSQPGFLSSNDWNTFNNKPSVVNVQYFNTAGTFTWTKPTGAKSVRVQIIAGGAGGCGGPTYASGGGTSTGAGGGGGGRSLMEFDASTLGATEIVVVGAGGAGGISQTGNTQAMSAASSGNASSFGSWFYARGALGPTSAAVTAGGIGTYNGLVGSLLVAPGAQGSNPGNGANPNDAVSGNPGSGGSGSSASTGSSFFLAGFGAGVGGVTNSPIPAGNGAFAINEYICARTVAANSDGANGQNGNNAPVNSFYGGGGGGGGSMGATGNGGAGGNGGYPGGGGGSGGGAFNGHASGAGGKGGDGIVIVTTFF